MELIDRGDALHIVDVAEDEHPYKVPGLFVTYSEYNQGWSDAVDFIQSRIEKSPTIDAVPVVQCKDCKYWMDIDNGRQKHEMCAQLMPNWFCADGKMREVQDGSSR